LQRWGIKTRTNDELRQVFVNQLVPELHALGISIPDLQLHFDEGSGNWITGPIDWDEFWRVVKGHGPCNKERMEARRSAHAEGAWVREALTAYQERQ
jgi:ring-1,2-phenylacetyl-CoA epoxidase subunit PaaA